jgi:uncharacterized protein YlxP (DUF503 family)
MVVGTLEVRLLVREARTLKDKRQVVKSIVDKLRQNFNVSVAEIDAQDKHQLAVLGTAQVGHEAYAVRTTLEKIAESLRRHPVAEFLEQHLEVI